MNLIFCLQINVKGFFKLLLSLQVIVARHDQITQISYLQYLKKEFSDEVDFLHADKHESLLQIDSMILMWMVNHSQSSQNRKFAMSLNYLKKEVNYEVDFCMQINIKVYVNTLGINVSYKVDIIIINVQGFPNTMSSWGVDRDQVMRGDKTFVGGLWLKEIKYL